MHSHDNILIESVMNIYHLMKIPADRLTGIFAIEKPNN